MTALINGLGGSAGFGENVLDPNDDQSTGYIDLTAIFNGGFNFFGTTYDGLYLNNNGNVTFGGSSSTFTPFGITGSSAPIIAAFFADVDTRGGAVPASAGGTSTGSNLVYYDLDATSHTFTATWDDVGYYSYGTDKLNAFQIQIQQLDDGASDNFRITFRYEDIQWTTGSASGGEGGLGGTVARAGYSAGDGTTYFELGQSGDQAAMLNLENRPGVISFDVANGAVNAVPIADDDTATTTRGQTVSILAGENDFDPDGTIVSFTAGQAGHGAVTIGEAAGEFVYTPDAGFVGTDSFTYTVTDDDGATDTATVTVTVEAPVGQGVTLKGKGGADNFTGTEYNDTLIGGGGDDRLTGLGGNDRLVGGAGNDRISGGAGDDSVIGGIGDDRLSGGTGKDKLIGNDGADLLYGGKDSDTYIGGAGADIFIFGSQDGPSARDKILDFQDGIDRIGLMDINGDFSYTVTASKPGAIVTFSDGQSVLLKGIAAASIDASDFITQTGPDSDWAMTLAA